MVYGDDAVETSQENVAGTWTDSLVMHFGEASGSGAYIQDSTSNNHDGTPTGTTYVDGKIGKARDFALASTDHVSIADHADFDFGTGNFTISFWVRFDSVNSYLVLFSKDTLNGAPGGGYLFLLSQFECVNRLKLHNQATGWPAIMGNTPIAAATPYYVALVRSGNVFTLYLNAASEGTDTDAGTMNGNATPFAIGGGWPGVGEWSAGGYVDEFRVFKGTARTANHITTCYNNQSSPSTFYSVEGVNGAEVYQANCPASDTEVASRDDLALVVIA